MVVFVFSLTSCICVTDFVFCVALEGTERDYLPHQEARMKVGLEKAVKHKDKLLEFDKNRSGCPNTLLLNYCCNCQG